MKKYLFVIMLLAFLASCNSSDNNTSPEVTTDTKSQTDTIIYNVTLSWNPAAKGVDISWDAAEETDTYLVERSEDNGNYLPITYVTKTTSYTDRTVRQFHTYRYRIKTIRDTEIFTSLPSANITIPDILPPDLRFVETPSPVTTSMESVFEISASDPGNPTSSITLECNIDGTGWFPCNPLTKFPITSYGKHTFEVRASDSAGNTTPQPLQYSWEVTTTIWKMISGGYQFFCGLTTRGRLYCWGTNGYGELGTGDFDIMVSYLPREVSPKNWQKVTTSRNHACAIDGNRDLYCWGDDSYYQLGDGDGGWGSEDRYSPKKVLEYGPSAGNWTDVSAGLRNTCGIKSDGTLWCWGRNYYGMLGIGSWDTSFINYTPEKISLTNDWKAVFLSKLFSSACAIKTDGTLWCWGRNDTGELGTGDNSNRNYPTQISDARWKKIAFFTDHANGKGTIGLREDGTLWVWGSSIFLGVTDTTTTYSPILLSSKQYKDIFGGYDNVCAIETNGKLHCWGSNTTQQLGQEDVTLSYNTPLTIFSDYQWETGAISDGSICGIRNNTTLYCWGNNTWGGLGYREEIYSDFQKSDYDKGLKMFGQGNDGFICAIDDDGRLLCWGDNSYSQLGVGDKINRKFPVQVTTETGWKFISASEGGVLAINKDNQLYAWGRNSNYQLGIDGVWYGATVGKPALVGNDWKLARIRNGASCGIKLDSTLWCWGIKYVTSYSVTYYKTPTPMTTATGWKDVAPDRYTKCAVKFDGSLWCWESTNLNDFGFQANGPVLISNDNWDKVYTYRYNACAIKFDGSLWCWGRNSYGELGVGDTSSRGSMVQIGTDHDWKSIAMGYGYTCGIKYNGDLYCWGTANPFPSDSPLTPQYVPANHIWKDLQTSLTGTYFFNPTVCLLDIEDHLYCSGSNVTGVMGLAHSPYDNLLHHVEINNETSY